MDLTPTTVHPIAPLHLCVLGVDDPDVAISLATATVSATDQHPRMAQFVAAREEAKLFAAEARMLQQLDVDRAIASIAFAALQLDRASAACSNALTDRSRADSS